MNKRSFRLSAGHLPSRPTTSWSARGVDVNAWMQHTFGLGPVDWSSIGMYWLTRMQAELSLMQRHQQLSQHYERHYLGG